MGYRSNILRRFDRGGLLSLLLVLLSACSRSVAGHSPAPAQSGDIATQDASAAASGSIALAGGGTVASSLTVTLTVVAPPRATSVAISEQQTLAGANWQQVAPTLTYTFTSFGDKVLYYAFQDASGIQSFPMSLHLTITSPSDTASRWSPISSVNAPDPRTDAIGFWTGKNVVVWGGFGTSACLGSGGVFDPVANAWRPMATGPTGRCASVAVWTGTVMIVWGGYSETDQSVGATADATSSDLGDGAIYDPAADTWRTIATQGAPAAREYASAVWTGTEMVVWGGSAASAASSSTTQYFGDGAAYNPTTNTWRPISSQGAPTPRDSQVVVWTGSRMLVWGGDSDVIDPNPTASVRGAAYDPQSDQWSPINGQNAPTALYDAQAVWTGTQMAVWDGHSFLNGQSSTLAATYDPVKDAWQPMAMSAAVQPPQPRYAATAVWTGNNALMWGGSGANGPAVQDGVSYDPQTNAWVSFTGGNPPAGRSDHVSVWTGTGLFVWSGMNKYGLTDGGFGGANLLADGAIYKP